MLVYISLYRIADNRRTWTPFAFDYAGESLELLVGKIDKYPGHGFWVQ